MLQALKGRCDPTCYVSNSVILASTSVWQTVERERVTKWEGIQKEPERLKGLGRTNQTKRKC